MSTLYTARYEYPNGRKHTVSFIVNHPKQALPWAADFVRYCVKGYLLAIEEIRPVAQQELLLT